MRGYGEVPGWHQGTMKDWRGYYHGNHTYGCRRPNLRFPADARKLALDPGRLTGELDVAFRLDRAMTERQPPGTYVQWWDKFIIGGFSVPRNVRYILDAEVVAGARLLELILEDGVYWDDAFVPDKKGANRPHRVSRRPIHVRLQVPATRFTRATVKTPSWIPGFHEAEPARLEFEDDHLTGTLIVYLHQDGWMPWGRGKHTQHEPITVTFNVDARLERNELHGRYSASFGGELKGKHYNPRGDDSEVVVLPETHYEGAIGGRGGKLVIGRYAAQGAFGEYEGAVDGMVLDQPRPLRERVGLPEGGASAANINTVLHQVRALHLALENEALPLEEALRQADWPAPVDAAPDVHLAAAARQMAALAEPGAARPEAVPETVGDSPSYGAAAAAPDLVVLPAAGYGSSTQRWQAVTCTDARLGAPWERSQFFPRYNGNVWYGAATLRSERARKVWLSLEANDFAKLWVNELLVWVERERTWRYRSYGRQFVPVELAAGDNRFLVRVHNDYQLAWLRLALTTRKPAAPPLEPPRVATSHPHIFPDADPPLAWDIERGINVAWRSEALGGATRPLALGDAVFVTHGAGTLACLDAATGKLRWSRDVNADVEPPARGQPPAADAVVAVAGGVAFIGGYGTVASYDAAGALRWACKADLPGARLRTCGPRLVVEGQAPVEGRAPPMVRVLALDAASGGELWRREVPGRLGGQGVDLTTGDASALLTCTGVLLDLSTPAVAGKYLFLLGGRSDNSRYQIAVVTADDRLQLIASQDVEPGTTRPPVFSGERMFVRSSKSLICVAVKTAQGLAYQRKELARTLFQEIGREPRSAEPRGISGLDRVSALGDVPIGKFMNGRPTEFWLGAGPFTVGSLKGPAALAAVRAKVGTVVAGKAFVPLSRLHAYREPPAYIRTGELQGTGDITPRFKSRVDPRGVSGPAGSGLLYTVLDNVRDRLVAPVLKGKGITQWLGGRKLAPDTPVHLSPGLYPYLVLVDPEFYDVKEKEILVPVNVTNALAKGALRDVVWPKMWQVLGPLPADAATLPGEQLRAVPMKLVVGEQDCRLFPFPVKGYTVDLGCLVKAELGEEPNRAAEFLKPTQSVTAYAFATIECPADGYLYISAASDWYMCWYVDGVLVYDRLEAGNAARPGDINAHPFAVRVGRGRHVVVIRLRAGGGGWNFTSMGGFSEKPGDQLAEFRVESRLKKGPPDFRLQPCFREIPYPPTLKQMWRDRIRAREDRLKALVADPPDGDAAERAKGLLEAAGR